MSYGAIVAANAAVARRRQALLEKEEEEMTQYTQDDLSNDWEFKIVRSSTAVFRKPKELNKLIEEEAHAGWMMLEKLDDSRIRFKRPRSARARDSYLPADVDPYRTQYGVPSTRYALWAGVVVGLVVLTLGVLGSSLADGIGALIGPAIATIPIALILVVLGLVLLIRKLR